MLIATFSNGHTDTYKGTREVKAAWMITNAQTGEVLASGHSLDRAKAQRTAEGNTAIYHGAGKAGRVHDTFPGHSLGHIACRRRSAQLAGWDGKGRPEAFLKDLNVKAKAARDATVKIEVIDL